MAFLDGQSRVLSQVKLVMIFCYWMPGYPRLGCDWH